MRSATCVECWASNGSNRSPPAVSPTYAACFPSSPDHRRRERPWSSAPRRCRRRPPGCCCEAAADQPLVLVLEDVHWADQSSRDVLDHLVRSLRNERLAVVLTVRTDDPAYDDVSGFVAELGSLRRTTRVQLDRLGREDVAAQVRELDGTGPAEAPDLERILDISGGVPLLVEELVASGASDLDQLADRLLGHRVRRLDTQARSVVDAAAVALVDIRLDDLAAVVDLTPEDFDIGVAGAVSGGVLVRRAGSIAFRHALLREAAAASLPPGRATRLHRAWAERLDGRARGLAEAVAVAQHWTAGDRMGPALHSWLRAAVSPRRSPPTPSRPACSARRRTCGPEYLPTSDRRTLIWRGSSRQRRRRRCAASVAWRSARSCSRRRGRPCLPTLPRLVGRGSTSCGTAASGTRTTTSPGRRPWRRPATSPPTRPLLSGPSRACGRRASAGVARTSPRPTPSARRRLRWPGPSVTSS